MTITGQGDLAGGFWGGGGSNSLTGMIRRYPAFWEGLKITDAQKQQLELVSKQMGNRRREEFAQMRAQREQMQQLGWASRTWRPGV